MIDETEDFFSLDDFAETVKLNNRTVTAIFDRLPITHDDGFSSFSSIQPTLTVQTSAVESSGIEQGGVVVVRANTYSVVDIINDGTGITQVILQLR